MDHFVYKNDEAYCEGVPLASLASKVGTPLYVYSAATLAQHCEALKSAFASYPTSFCYAVKACSNLSILRSIFQQGLGADVVSLGELERALLAGADPRTIVFSGVGKQEHEIRRALEVGILSFNVESLFELRQIADEAKSMGLRASLSLRINPDVDARTASQVTTGLYSTKFGIPEADIAQCLNVLQEKPGVLSLVGLSCHIGSQLTELSPLITAAQKMRDLAETLRSSGFPIKMLNMGGGLGIRYTNETPPSLVDYARSLIGVLQSSRIPLVIEPGRVLVGNTGVLLTRVIGTKTTPTKNFVIVDAAMNDLSRPSVYGSMHEPYAVRRLLGMDLLCDIVGPICETTDFLRKDFYMPLPKGGDLLYFRTCGAYVASMASNYNSRPRAAEVLVEGDGFRVIRRRESLEQLWREEL
ncbi:MAG: diaminopimelate decarboxylase [Deltaproteobacteria bacterium]|nr:diaminopimelate decarboxylase [Deltaproteobacteria bacterium]